MKVISISSLAPDERLPYLTGLFEELNAGECLYLAFKEDPELFQRALFKRLGNTFDWKDMGSEKEWEIVIRKLESWEKSTLIGEVCFTELPARESKSREQVSCNCGNLVKSMTGQVNDESGGTREILPIPLKDDNHYESLGLDRLCHLLESEYHENVRNGLRIIEPLLALVSASHAKEHPYLERVLISFRRLADEMIMHMQKEEMVLFPYARKLEESRQNHLPPPSPYFESIEQQLRLMEAEHQSVEHIMDSIRMNTSDFHLVDQCEVMMHVYHVLRIFGNNLNHHLHLERDIMFAKTVELEQELRGLH